MEKKIHVITISRQYGAGGSELGLLLSEKLGIPLYNHEILSEISRGTGIRENVLRAADERMDNFQANRLIEFLPSREREALEADTVFNQKTLYSIQEDTIRRLADYALREREDVLAVFLYAPKEWRIRRMMRMENIPGDEAARKRRRIDRERRSYCKYYTGREWDDCSRYDYMFNTASLKLETIAEILCRRMREEP